MKKFKIITLSFVLLTALLVAQEFKLHLLGRVWNEFVLDNYDHYLSCDELPTKEYVQSVLEANQELVDRIQKIDSAYNSVFVSMGNEDSHCPDKADVIIYYGGHPDRVQIEEILGGKKFLGIPVRFRNV